MKKYEKNVQLLRYAMYFVFVIVLSSCDKDALGDKPVGELVPISINLLGISEGNVENLSRSSAAPAEPITETVVLGDGLLMEMSLAPDPAAELRDAAPTPLAEGVKFVVIAVKAADSTYVSHAEYTIVGGSPALPGGTEAAHVPAGGNYRFICVSLNSTISPENYSYDSFETGSRPTFANIPATADLLFWTTDNMSVNEHKVLPVTLRHTSNVVKVKVDCRYNGWDISAIAAAGIKLNTVGTVTLNSAGAVSGSATTKAVTWPSLTAAQTQESSGDTVYLSKLDIELAANALTLSTYGNAPSAAATAKFSSASFTAGGGKSYVLTLKVKRLMFASSNIYWDAANTRLTFDGYMENPASQNKYQGVHIKFGSLVGISPVGNNTAATVYVPTYVPSDTLNSTWDGTGNISSEFTNYTNIPYARGGSSTDIANRYASTFLKDSFPDMRGDICLYLEHTGAAPPRYREDLHWRLPAAIELFGNAWTKVSGSWSNPGTTNAAGTFTGITWGYKYMNNFFPASGCRSNATPQDGVGVVGYYISSSISTGNDFFRWKPFDTNTASTGGLAMGRLYYGLSVRCVLQE
jgi:hypothetical protein